MQARHFTYEGRHYYRLFDGGREMPNNRDLELFLADGKPLPELLSRLAPNQRIFYVPIDHEVQQWERRQFHHQTRILRRDTATENPFRFDLPQEFETENAFVEWWADASGGLCYDWDMLCAYYERKYEQTEIEPAPLDMQIVELGEWEPPPAVWFSWDTDAPWSRVEPEEMQHLFPCRSSGGSIKDALKVWLNNEKSALGVKAHYLDQSGGSVYFVDGTSINTSQFFSGVHAKNLNELLVAMDDRLAEAKAYVSNMAATAKCPHCGGSGRRMHDAGRSQLVEDIKADVRLLKTTRNASRCSRVVAKLEQLSKQVGE